MTDETTVSHYRDLLRALHVWLKALMDAGKFDVAFELRAERDWLAQRASQRP